MFNLKLWVQSHWNLLLGWLNFTGFGLNWSYFQEEEHVGNIPGFYYEAVSKQNEIRLM